MGWDPPVPSPFQIILSPSGDTTGTADTAAIKNAITNTLSAAGVIYFRPGTYYINDTIVVGPVGGANPVRVPSFVSLSSAGELGDTSDVGPVQWKAASGFTSGQFMLDFQQTSGTAYGPSSSRISGITFHCNSLAAGLRLQGPRGFRIESCTIVHTVAPSGYGTSDNGALSVNYITGAINAGAYNQFSQLTISNCAADGIFHNAPTQDVFVGCHLFACTDYAIACSTASQATFIGCDVQGGSGTQEGGWYLDGSITLAVNCNTEASTLTGNAVILAGSGQSLNQMFVGCQFTNDPSASPGEEAGSIVAIKFTTSRPQLCRFVGCQFLAGTNTTDFVYAESTVTGTVVFSDCSFSGTVATSPVNDSLSGILSFDNCSGLTTGYVERGTIGSQIAVAGGYLVPNFIGGSTSQFPNGDMRPVPIWVPRTVTVTELAVNITVAGSTGAVIRLGIYNADSVTGEPGTLVLDGGTVAATGTGATSVTISQILTPGLYWLVAVNQGAPATLPTTYYCVLLGGQGATSFPTSDSAVGGAWEVTAVTGALPSSPTWTQGGGGNPPPLVAALVHS